MAQRSTAGGCRTRSASMAGRIRPFPLRPFAALVALAAMVAATGVIALPTRPANAAAFDRFYANFAGEELMRAMNADRAALGIPAFATDATLENLSRDRPVTCPSNASLTIRGRARDMADRGYFSHDIAGCSEPSGAPFSTFDLLKAIGYTFTSVGEDIAANDFGTGATSYATGCNLSGGSCHGSITLPSTVAGAERGFMSSQGHRDNLLSTGFTRFGCGAWTSSAGNRIYSCYFASGGSGLLDGTGPAVSSRSGVGATFAVGTRPTFTASAADARSVLSDGWAAIDGRHIADWAWDHAGSAGTLSAVAPSLTAGRHTFTWWVRDASTRPTTSSFTFSAGSSTVTPPPTSGPTARPTPVPTTRATSQPTNPAGPGASPTPSSPSTPPPPSAQPRPSAASSDGPVGSPTVPGAGGPVASGGVADGGGSPGSGGPPSRAPVAVRAGVGGGPGGDSGGAALAAVLLLLLLGVGVVPPTVVMARSGRPPRSG